MEVFKSFHKEEKLNRLKTDQIHNHIEIIIYINIDQKEYYRYVKSLILGHLHAFLN